jgi:hypothetical protein
MARKHHYQSISRGIALLDIQAPVSWSGKERHHVADIKRNILQSLKEDLIQKFSIHLNEPVDEQEESVGLWLKHSSFRIRH